MTEKKETKIIIKSSDELSDIVEKISKTDSDRIILTFTEPSDLLISSINLTVLREAAEENGKSIIAQIIKNPTGERNSQNAGLITINTPSNPTEDLWIKAEKENKEIQREREEKLGQRLPKEDAHQEDKIEKSSFEKKIDEALSKTRDLSISPDRVEKVIEEEGVKISLDSEISKSKEVSIEEEQKFKPEENHYQKPLTAQHNMIGSDVNPKITLNQKQAIKPPRKKLSDIFKFKKADSSEKRNVIKMNKRLPNKKIIIWGSVGLFLCILLGAFLYYYFAPLVKVKIFVDSKPVSIEKTFAGSIEQTDIDIEKQIVPLKEESVEQDASDSITPTGKSVTGEKATGTVRINYLEIGGTLDLPSGTVLTGSGKTFVTLADLHLIGPNWSEVSVEATNYGSEYNVPFETYFSVQGYSDSVLSGSALADFSGGSKTEVTVLSQNDVDTAAANLAKAAKEDAENDLLDKHIGDGWEVIKDSLKSEVDEDSVETDVPIGTESTTANISLSVKVSALYYKEIAIEDIVDDLLSEEAKNKDLFEAEGNMDLELADDIETDYIVSGTKAENIKVKVKASGVVTPKVDKEKILATLKGMGWDDGINYLSDFDYSDQQIEISFEPSSFPKWLRYFPGRQGRIMISTVYVKE